MDMKEIVCRLA